MKKLVFFLFISTFSLAQKDGFWDKERAFTKEIKLASGNRTLVKVDELPEGTSEFVYRISLIDENGKITTSLASVLKAIPDPTGISQGTAGAITLTNAVSGDDTCIYGIFTSEKAGTQFLKDGKVDKACYSVKEAINKDSKVISIKNTSCLDNAPNIWFAFENKNWVMSTKIVLEVVAWVDYKMSRGWNLETKKELMAIGERLDWYKKSPKPDAFLAQFMESFAAKYKYYLLGGRTAATGTAFISSVYSADISSDISDYSPYYDDTVTPEVIPDKSMYFTLPDFSADEPFGSYSYIKY